MNFVAKKTTFFPSEKHKNLVHILVLWKFNRVDIGIFNGHTRERLLYLIVATVLQLNVS